MIYTSFMGLYQFFYHKMDHDYDYDILMSSNIPSIQLIPGNSSVYHHDTTSELDDLRARGKGRKLAWQGDGHETQKVAQV